MNPLLPLPRPPVTPLATLVLTPAYSVSALASGIQVEVRARPVRKVLPIG